MMRIRLAFVLPFAWALVAATACGDADAPADAAAAPPSADATVSPTPDAATAPASDARAPEPDAAPLPTPDAAPPPASDASPPAPDASVPPPDASVPPPDASVPPPTPDAQVAPSPDAAPAELHGISPADLNAVLAGHTFALINVHVPYAGELAETDVHIVYTDTAALIAYLGPDLDRPAVVYCLTDHMALIAGNALVAAGYREITYLEGGMRAWEAAGYPLLHLR